MRFSVIIPAYNEEKNIMANAEKILKFFNTYNRDYEILIVNDGSNDGTEKIARAISKKFGKVRVISHARNMGVGAALRTGLSKSRGDIVISVDSDLTYEPNEIPNLVRKLEETGADIVIGTPYIRRGDDAQIPPLRRLLSHGANLVDRILFGLDFTTPTCIFRVWRKAAAKRVRITFNRFEGVAESAIYAHKKGMRIVEAPVKYNLRKNRVSSVNPAREIKKHVQMIFKLNSLR